MKEENKKEIKKGILTGVGTAAGAVIGAVVENTINAADVEVRDIPEAEVVDPIEEDLNEVAEFDQSVIEVEHIDSEDKVNNPSTHTSHSGKKPVKHRAGDSISSNTSEEELEASVEVDAVIQPETEPEVIVTEDSEPDEDIMVVSVAPVESDEEEAEVYDVTMETSDNETISADDQLVPDYADMKDNDLSVGSSMMSTTDMPDYVNDANIDSFTDNV